ncbi:MAG: hypothetical protein KatS3mg015_1467 [Fimbriimonadales bacterium]|nr:MAG: hypothetical protein KatS3mg015_1467 [Fimbriimonadales bacterium]
MARMAMLIDLTRCIGCDACTLACKQENGTPVDVFFARVLNVEIGMFPNVKRLYIPVLCNHCEDAPCLKACPNKAIIKRPDGIVLIDQDRCRGTGACVSACPYGNIYLKKQDAWYLEPGEAYEEQFVKPRLKPNVARKCTYCAHRVDQGLDPACVVACPTTARIFGDLDDPDSKISRYIVEQERETGRKPFHLLPGAKTRPAGCYLGPMSAQSPASTDQPRQEPRVRTSHRSAVSTVLSLLAVLTLLLLVLASARANEATEGLDHYSTSSCLGCHGVTAHGGMGPPLASTPIPYEQFLSIVRNGKGMMPKTPASEMSDEEVRQIYEELKAKALNPDEIPIAFKVGQFLSTRNVALIFLFVTLFSILFAIKVLAYWVGISGAKELLPYLPKFGVLKAAGIFLWSLIVDGFLVASLWRKDRFRWAMHGLLLYGFTGLMVADILIQIFNPTRSEMPLFSPLKMLPILSGIAVLAGVSYVMYRYKTDRYIDNGLTLGRDFFFVNLLLHTIVSGFLTVWVKRAGLTEWVMPVYLYHLCAIALLLGTAPFTRFSHAFVVPVMAAITRLTEAMTAAGIDLGFQREPSPGRHHKSLKIARQVLDVVDPEHGEVKLRYYP